MENQIVLILIKPNHRHGDAAFADELVNPGQDGEARHRLHLAGPNLEDDILLERGVEVNICCGGHDVGRLVEL